MTDDKTYTKAVVRITELVGTDGQLEGFAFSGCQINGPAILYVLSGAMVSCNLGTDPGAVVWVVDPAERPEVSGVIACHNCTFEECTFANIGFVAASPEQEATLKSGSSA